MSMHFRSRGGVSIGILGLLSAEDNKVRWEADFIERARNSCIPCQGVLVFVILSFALHLRVWVEGSGSKRTVSRYEITSRSVGIVTFHP